LAPIEMAWKEKPRARFAGRSRIPIATAAVISPSCTNTSPMMIWWPGWHPGPGRDPAPGNQERLGELIKAWIDTGAQCP
jgi:hypothetical protein